MTATITVWEGEWPLLKYFVREARTNATKGFHIFMDIVDGREYVRVVKSAAAQSDEIVMNSSKRLTREVRSNPWIIPATGIGAASLFIFSKSLRWGAYAATRNGILFGGATTCLLYPHDVRAVILSNLPF